MSLNKVILIGNVGRDPEVRYFDSCCCQLPACNFREGLYVGQWYGCSGTYGMAQCGRSP